MAACWMPSSWAGAAGDEDAMRILIERSILAELLQLGRAVAAGLEDEIGRRGLSPDPEEDPDGDHCRCSYRFGRVTVIGTFTKATNSLLLDRIAIDEVVDLERDRLPLSFLIRLLEGATPLLLWREHRGLSQRELAELVGVRASYLSEVERGLKPGSLPLLTRAAAALEVTVEELTGWASTPSRAQRLRPPPASPISSAARP